LFTVLVAGNDFGDECVGSVIYALDKFAPAKTSSAPGSLKLILVIGHRNCGGDKDMTAAGYTSSVGHRLSADSRA
jgi:carbonic anhydrase